MKSNSEIDAIIGQQIGFDQNGFGNQLSSTPYYIQALERKIATLDYKLNLILESLENQQTKQRANNE